MTTANRHARADLVVGVLFLLMLTLLGAGLSGAHRVFGGALVAWLGVLVGIGFARRGEPRTWIASILVFAWLVFGMGGVLANESAVVRSVADTVLGFHPGTAYLVYGIWFPAVFTLGVAFVMLFDRLVDVGQEAS